jgi:hypothetical protein
MERIIRVRQAPEQALEESARALARASFTKVEVDAARMVVSAEKRPAGRWSRGTLTVAAEPADAEARAAPRRLRRGAGPSSSARRVSQLLRRSPASRRSGKVRRRVHGLRPCFGARPDDKQHHLEAFPAISDSEGNRQLASCSDKRDRKGAYGIRTRAAAVRGRCPRPLDECAGCRSLASGVGDP